MADSSFRINRGITLNPQASAPTAPTNGDIYYDSTMGTFSFYDNGFWINLASRQDVASAASLTSANFTAAVVQHSLIRLTGATAGTIHGIAASTDGNMVVIYNNTNQLITVANQSVTEATAQNRIVTHTAADIVIPSGMTLKLVYDSAQSRWVFAAPAIDGLDKLFEDRNVLLTQGGLITYTGTQVQFTEALALEVNQREAGGAPTVISLGSTTRNVSASGRMIYATIDRVAGTAVITDDATTLPAAVPVNQEIFLIAKRVDAADGTKRLYWRNGMALNEGQTARLGASGSGDGGSGVGDDINTLSFKASFRDDFAESSTSNNSAVDSALTTGTYNAAAALYRLSYDASRTVTGTGTSMTISATPSYTVAVGDMLVVGTEARRITVVTTQTSLTIESAFSTDPTAAACTLSQTVHTKDILSHTENGSGLALNAVFTESLDQFMLRYRDSAAAGDAIWDFPGAALVAYSATTDSSSWTSVQSRQSDLSSDLPIVSAPAAGTQFKVRFFSAATSGSGAVNVLDYKAFLYRESQASSGSFVGKALARTDGAGTEVACSVSSDSGKTRITTTFAFGTEVEVYLDGKKIPEFVDSTLTPDASFTRLSGNVIELDSDYSGLGLQIEVIVPSNTVDNTNQNAANISALQDMSTAAFQGMVDESSRLTAVNGAPSTGQFRTFGIVNRASIPDLANDLKARMGIDRVQIQQIVELQNEFGPNGEQVFGVPNDDRNLIRFVGRWQNRVDTIGQSVSAEIVDTNYCEIVFYGTGLNALLVADAASNPDIRATIDGGAEGGNIMPNMSTVIDQRNYSANKPISIVSGLSLGIHTVKLRFANISTVRSRIHGFEILNESANVNVRPGTAYQGGKKLILSAADSTAYNTGFESVTREGASVAFSSTRGARVVEYLKSDNTKAKAAYLTNSAQANLGSADHSYEEVIRTYHFREFGASRTDDFSTYSSASSTNLAFTLDDGVTSLVGSQMSVQLRNGVETLVANAVSTFWTFTFVGTGLDLVATNNANSGTAIYTISVDGTSIGNYSTMSTSIRTIRLVSGLPYGTHVVRISNNGGNTHELDLIKFVVYGPKKPTVPSGAVELADYNVMADYVANATAGLTTIASGTLRKASNRELTYVGAGWTTNFDVTAWINGTGLFTTTNGDYVEYTFFGTGFEYRGRAGNDKSSIISVTLNGLAATTANFPTLTSSVYGVGVTFSSGTFDMNDATQTLGCGLRISGLPLAVYKVRMTNGQASQFNVDSFDVITPLHSHKSNVPADLQNTLPVGSCAILDSRKISLIKSEDVKKFRGVAMGITSSPSTTSTSAVPMPDMSLSIKSSGNWFELNISATVTINAIPSGATIRFLVNGQQVGIDVAGQPYSGNADFCVSNTVLTYLNAGVHKVDIYWFTTGNTMTARGTQRVLTAKEL